MPGRLSALRLPYAGPQARATNERTQGREQAARCGQRAYNRSLAQELADRLQLALDEEEFGLTAEVSRHACLWSERLVQTAQETTTPAGSAELPAAVDETPAAEEDEPDVMNKGGEPAETAVEEPPLALENAHNATSIEPPRSAADMLSQAKNMEDKRAERAKRFGIPTQQDEEAKKRKRAERFNIKTAEGDQAKRAARLERFKDPAVAAEEAKRKARAERFRDPSAAATEQKLKARAARFGTAAAH